MRRVHIDYHQALFVLAQDVDPVKLGQGVAEGRNVAVTHRRRVAHRSRRRFGDEGGEAHRRLRERRMSVVPSRRKSVAWRCAGIGSGARICQQPMDGSEDEVVHATGIPKTDFALGRMHIDIDASGIEFQEQHEHRMTSVEHHIPVGLSHRVARQPVLHGAAVHEEELGVGLGARVAGQADPAGQTQIAVVRVDGDGLGQKLGAHDRVQIPPGGQPFQRALAMPEFEGDIAVGERQSSHRIAHMAGLRAFGFEELSPRGRVVEQVRDLDRRADRMGRGLEGLLGPARHGQGHAASSGYR